MAGDVVRPRFATHLLHDQPCQCVGEVGVLPASLRRERGLPLRHQRLQLFACRKGERCPVVSRLARQTGAVGQQLLDGDGRIVLPWGRHREPGQVLRHRIVQMELALLAQLHDGGCREQLAVRGHAEFRLRRHRHIAGDIGQAEPLGPHEPLIRDNANDHSRVAAGAELPVGPSAEQSLGAEDVRVRRGVFRGGSLRKRARGQGHRDYCRSERDATFAVRARRHANCHHHVLLSGLPDCSRPALKRSDASRTRGRRLTPDNAQIDVPQPSSQGQNYNRFREVDESPPSGGVWRDYFAMPSASSVGTFDQARHHPLTNGRAASSRPTPLRQQAH